MLISEYIESLEAKNSTHHEIAKHLGVSASMVSAYMIHKYNPSIKVAMHIYTINGIVLHPFAKDSLEYEILALRGIK